MHYGVSSQWDGEFLHAESMHELPKSKVSSAPMAEVSVQ